MTSLHLCFSNSAWKTASLSSESSCFVRINWLMMKLTIDGKKSSSRSKHTAPAMIKSQNFWLQYVTIYNLIVIWCRMADSSEHKVWPYHVQCNGGVQEGCGRSERQHVASPSAPLLQHSPHIWSTELSLANAILGLPQFLVPQAQQTSARENTELQCPQF